MTSLDLKSSLERFLRGDRESIVLRFPRPQPDQTTPPVYTLDGLVIPTADTATDLGVTVDTELKFHSHVQSIAHKASGLLHSLLKATVCRSKEFMIFLLVTHIRPVLEYSAWLWYTGYVNDTCLLEKVQRQWTKYIEGLSDLSYADHLKFLNLYSVQGRLLSPEGRLMWSVLRGLLCGEVLKGTAALATRHQMENLPLTVQR